MTAVRLPWRPRLLLAGHAVLTRAGLLPDSVRVQRLPMEKRLAFASPPRLVGAVPTVEAEDRWLSTRDGAEIRVRIYRAAHAGDQPLLYFHGGGFVVGGIAACDHICRRLAHDSGAVVVSVEYRLAPEHRFPGPLNDCLDAAEWLVQRAGELAIDPDRLVVGGDSAGGNLAAAVAISLRDSGRPLAGQLLVYPAIDLSLSLPGLRSYRGVGLKEADLRACATAYLGDHDPTDPLASPWYADAAGLAPAFVLTVRHDILGYEGVAYAEKLLRAGVPVTHVAVEDHAHGSLSTPVLFRGVDQLYGRIAAFVREPRVHAG